MILDGYREIEDEEAAINLIYMWHPPKFASILSHWHERIELLYVLEGSLDVLCGDLSATVRGGEVVVINPNQLHAASSGEDGVKYYALRIDDRVLLNLCDDETAARFIRPIVRRKAQFCTFIRDEQIVQILQDLIAEYDAKEEAGELMIRSDILRLFALLSRRYRRSENDLSVVRGRFEDVLTYVGEHFTEDLTTENVARRFSFNKSHFCRCFRSQTGMPFLHYLNQLRLDLAAFLLSTTDRPITAVALECGFGDANYFARKFRERYGVTCREYRREHLVPDLLDQPKPDEQRWPGR